jgi:hypothetical protein
MTLQVRVPPAGDRATFGRDHIVRLGRGRTNDVRVGHERVQGRWTVSKTHAEVRWDGTRWSTLNVSDKPGLLCVYEPRFEEVPLEPGRPWVPVRHRWSYAVGRPGHRFHVVCETDDHKGPSAVPEDGWLVPHDPDRPGYVEDDPTAGVESAVALALTPLERGVLLAYYPSNRPAARPKWARRLRRRDDMIPLHHAPPAADARAPVARRGRPSARPVQGLDPQGDRAGQRQDRPAPRRPARRQWPQRLGRDRAVAGPGGRPRPGLSTGRRSPSTGGMRQPGSVSPPIGASTSPV